MTKREKLKVCNWGLLVVLIAVIATSVLLLGHKGDAFVGAHVASVVLLAAGVTWHLQLHFGAGNWFKKIRKVRSHVTRFLFWFALIVALSGLAALLFFLFVPRNHTASNIHGHLALLCLLIIIGHALKRRRWFAGNR